MLRWISLSLKGIAAVVLVLAALAGTAYASDYPVQATVTAKRCSTGSFGGFFGPPAAPGSITVKTKLFGIVHTMQGVPETQCQSVQVNNFVVYHVRSGRTSLYDREGGVCIYDSVGGAGGCR